MKFDFSTFDWKNALSIVLIIIIAGAAAKLLIFFNKRFFDNLRKKENSLHGAFFEKIINNRKHRGTAPAAPLPFNCF